MRPAEGNLRCTPAVGSAETGQEQIREIEFKVQSYECKVMGERETGQEQI